jgi:hypothetical protein
MELQLLNSPHMFGYQGCFLRVKGLSIKKPLRDHGNRGTIEGYIPQ